MRKEFSIILALLALMFAACGSEQEATETAANGSEASAQSPKITNKPAQSRRSKNMKPNAEGLVGSEPRPIIPDGPRPSSLVSQDLIEGDGETGHKGDRVTIQYVGVDYETQRKFDSSWEWGNPYSFELGAGEVIDGWDRGIDGMKVGDRRELVIPPDLAYGSGPVGVIPQNTPANATLVYVIDLLAVE